MSRSWIVLFLFLFPATSAAKAQNVTHSGGCMIVEVRHVAAGGPNLAQTCSHYQTWANQEGFVPVIAYSFGAAEVMACGHEGCAASQANVRIVVVNDSSINGWVVGDVSHHSVDIFLTYALMDFIDAPVSALLQQLIGQATHDSKPGILAWLSALGSRGGKACSAGMPRPDRVDLTQFGITNEQATTIQWNEDSVVLTFIFLHELAHLLTGGSCNENPNEFLKMELSCDKIARGWFVKDQVAPTPVLAWMVTIDDYVSLVGPLLNKKMGYVGDNEADVRAMFPASDWRVRSAALMLDWKSRCAQPGDEGVCKDFARQFEVATEIANVPRPKACIADGSGSARPPN